MDQFLIQVKSGISDIGLYWSKLISDGGFEGILLLIFTVLILTYGIAIFIEKMLNQDLDEILYSCVAIYMGQKMLFCRYILRDKTIILETPKLIRDILITYLHVILTLLSIFFVISGSLFITILVSAAVLDLI